MFRPLDPVRLRLGFVNPRLCVTGILGFENAEPGVSGFSYMSLW